MDEIIDIVDQNGHSTGKTALKSIAHKEGLPHNTIHLWLYTNDGKILLQQRSHKKSIFPLLWDVSVAGHIDAGESFTYAAIREAEEEIGIKLDEDQLIHIGVFKHFSIYNNGTIKDFEFHQVYISELKSQFNELTPQRDEVEALKLVTLEEFEHLLANSTQNSHFVPTNASYYKTVLKTIKQKTKR